MIETVWSKVVLAFQVPELHAIVVGIVTGFAVTYVASRFYPAWWPVRRAEIINRIVVFFVVFGMAVAMYPTPRTIAWAFGQALMTPLYYEWLFKILYHVWPWLKPEALKTGAEQNGAEPPRDAGI